MSLIDRIRVYVTGPGGIAWTVVVFLFATAWAFGGQGAWVDYLRFPFEAKATTSGTVIDADDTNVEINDRTVSWVTYSYKVEAATLQGLGYGSQYYPGSGTSIRVEYLVDDPQWSRIQGRTRVSMNGPVALVFAGMALALVPIAVWRSRKAGIWLKLMRTGRCGHARLLGKEATNVTVNDARVYELEFEYAREDGSRQTFKTRRSDYDDITDDDEELVLHDDSGNVLFFDELPVPFAPGRRGNWRHVGSGTLVGALLKRAIAPGIVLGLGAVFS